MRILRVLLVAVLAMFCSASGIAAPPEQAAEPPGPAAATDSFGDPLPRGALARLGTVRLRHGGRVLQMAFSPDGRRLFSVGRDNVLRAWSIPDGKPVWELSSHRDRPFCLAVSPDGKFVALPHQGAIAVINADTGDIAHQANCGGGIAHLAFGRDGKHILAAEFGKRIAAYSLDPDSARQDLAPWPGTGKLPQFDLSPDGSRIAVSVPHNEQVQLRSVPDGKPILSLARPDKTGPLGFKAFTPDGRSLAVGGRGIDGRITLWDLATKTVTRTLTGLTVAPTELHWLPSGTRLLSVTDEHLTIWDTTTGDPTWQFRDAALGFQCAAVSRDGLRLAVGCLGGQILLWDITDGQPVEHPPFTRGTAVYAASAAWWPNSRAVILAGPTVRLWDAELGQLKLEWSRPVAIAADVRSGSDARLELVAVSADGRRLAEAGPANGLAIRTLASADNNAGGLPSEPPNIVRRFGEGLPRPRALALSADGRWVWLLAEDATLSIWDTTTGALECRAHVQPDLLPTALAVQPHGRTAVGCTAQRVVAWDWSPADKTLSPTVLVAEREPGEVTTIAVGITAAGDITAIGPDTVRLWDRKTRGLTRQFPTDAAASAAGAVSLDGRWIATVSFGSHSLLLWEIATGKSLPLVPALPGSVRLLEFSPDGARLVTVGQDGTAHVWPTRPTVGVIAPTDDQERSACWDQLLRGPQEALNSAERLIAGGETTVDFVVARIARPESLSARIQALIRDLDAEDFQTRQDASEELFQLGPVIEPTVRELLRGPVSPEQRTRLTGLLERFEVKTPNGPRSIAGQVGGERLRSLRAIAILERVGSRAAVSALEKLAAGNAEDLETRHAADALTRLRRR